MIDPTEAGPDAAADTPVFYAATEDDARRHALAYAAAATGGPWTVAASTWEPEVGRLVVRFVRAQPWQSAGWIPGPPALSPPPPKRFVLKGLAVALVVVLVAITLARFADRVGSVPVGPAASVRPGPSFDARQPADLATLPRLEAVECRFQVPFRAEVTCHDLLMAQDRGNARAGMLRMHVATFASLASDPAPDPVVYLAGGPGGAGIYDFDDYTELPFLDTRDLIVVDQRGTGRSVPSLDCPERDAIDPFLVGSNLDSLVALGDCRDRLVGGGVSLSEYDSATIAADLDDLRTTMGIAQWNLYGVSYGTRLALTMMRDTPAGLRSVILDAVYPPQVDLYASMASNASRAFDALFDACTADARCRADHPDLRTEFFSLVTRLERDHPAMGAADSNEADGTLLVEYLFDQLYRTSVIPSLPGAIADIAAGRYAPLVDYLEKSGGLFAPDVDPNDIADGMHYSVQCAEELPFTDPAAFDTASRGLPGILRDTFAPTYATRACQIWDVTEAGPIENEPVTSGIPTLLLTGSLDPITPPDWARLTATTLSQSTVVEFPGAGHGVLGESECGATLATTFLEHPDITPDVGCILFLQPPPFE